MQNGEATPTTLQISFRWMIDQSLHASVAKGAPELAQTNDMVAAADTAMQMAPRARRLRRHRESSTPAKAPDRTNRVSEQSIACVKFIFMRQNLVCPVAPVVVCTVKRMVALFEMLLHNSEKQIDSLFAKLSFRRE